jgi:acyl transferase domain-containing protein
LIGFAQVGDSEEITKAQSELHDLNIVSVRIDSDGIPFHSPQLLKISTQHMMTAMSQQLLTPTLKPSKWLSTFESSSNVVDVDYFVRAATQPVNFCAALRSLPANCRVIELGVDEVLKYHIKQEVPDATYTAISQFK